MRFARATIRWRKNCSERAVRCPRSADNAPRAQRPRGPEHEPDIASKCRDDGKYPAECLSHEQLHAVGQACQNSDAPGVLTNRPRPRLVLRAITHQTGCRHLVSKIVLLWQRLHARWRTSTKECLEPIVLNRFLSGSCAGSIRPQPAPGGTGGGARLHARSILLGAIYANPNTRPAPECMHLQPLSTPALPGPYRHLVAARCCKKLFLLRCAYMWRRR